MKSPDGVHVRGAAGACTLTGNAGDDRWYRLQQAEAGLVVHRAALATTACGLAVRIHSDGTNAATDAVPRLSDPLHALPFLLPGLPRLGITVTSRLG